MRIRTRYTLFRVVIFVGIAVFLATLYDMFLNESAWKQYLFIAYAALAVLALILYIGYKPNLDEPEPETVAQEPVAAPVAFEQPAQLPLVAAVEPELDVVEVPRARLSVSGLNLRGPLQFQCPYCSHIFGFEATHERSADFRVHCPYCSKSIRVPTRPQVTRQRLVDLSEAGDEERALLACSECGELLRITAPHSRLRRLLKIESCPRCRSPQVVPAASGASA